MALGDQRLFPGDDSAWEGSWEPSQPDADDTLWRYMSFAKLCSLLEQRALFFALVGNMEDQHEGFVCQPPPRDPSDPLWDAERLGHKALHEIARVALVNCWTRSVHESSLMWNSYAGREGVALRSTFQNLQEAILSMNVELPVTFGKVEYVNYRQREAPRFGWAPLYHKRVEYQGEGELRAVLPGPPWKGYTIPKRLNDPVFDIPLDSDVAEQGGRYIPVDLDGLVNEVVVSPYAAPWFGDLVRSMVADFFEKVSVTPSTLGSLPDGTPSSRSSRTVGRRSGRDIA